MLAFAVVRWVHGLFFGERIFMGKVLQPPLRQLVGRAAQVIEGVINGGQNLNRLLACEVDLGRAAVQDMSYACLREYGWLSAVRDAALDRPVRDHRVAALLLVALRQLHVHAEQAHVIVNEAVEAAAALQPWARGLTNAVLRNVLRQGLFERMFDDPVARWNYPEWWINRLIVAFPQQWQGILAAGNAHPPMTLRVNARKIGVSGYIEWLADVGIQAAGIGISAVQLEQPVGIDRLPGFHEGDVSVQDAGAQHAALWLDICDGMRVLDACAAPGGKTGHILERANVELVALDSDPTRLAKVRDNLARLGLQAQCVVGDATQPVDWWDRCLFDRILADVPCSASGVVRRHPDIKWLRRDEDVGYFVAQQARILTALWPCLARGGKLLYVTCSVFPEENAMQIDRFMAQHTDARWVALSDNMSQGVQLFPENRWDGFYYALVEKM